MKKTLYTAPASKYILADTAEPIMTSTDVNAGGTQVDTGNDHGGGNAWEGGCAKGSVWSRDDNSNQN